MSKKIALTFSNPNWKRVIVEHYKADWNPKPALEKMPRRKKYRIRNLWNWVLNKIFS